jgi:tRNA pseudouridine38-40 synthase
VQSSKRKELRLYRATLAYDGARYQGFQRQAGGIPTVQASVEQAIKAVTQEDTTVIGAGRTDTGVHATGQVISFEVEWGGAVEVLLRALNATLPDDIAVQDLQEEPDKRFHPRFSALSRSYNYSILQSAQPQPLLRHRTWYIRQKLNIDVMQKAAGLLIGEHDFATFGQPPYGDNTVRRVFLSQWEEHGDILLFRIEATAFLKHMVRRVVGMLVEVGRGQLTVEAFESRFRRADLSLAQTVAPPQGLILEAVRYPISQFTEVVTTPLEEQKNHEGQNFRNHAN